MVKNTVYIIIISLFCVWLLPAIEFKKNTLQ